MPIMANRIFFSLALLSFAAFTSVCSYDAYRPYGPRDVSTLRQVRRCPTCPADCPESLASPWYGSPTVYGQSGPFRVSNENFESLPQQGSYSARDSAASRYGNPYFGGSNVYENSRCPCSHGGCNARSPRSGKQTSASEAHVEDAIPNRFDSIESRGPLIYGYHRSSPAASSFVPETYQEMDSVVGAMNTDNHRVSRHYGSYAYKDSMPSEQTTDEQSVGASDLSNWNGVALSAQQPIAEYENQPERMIYEGRLKAVETPSQKKVFVVYRADADETVDDDDIDRSLISSTSRQHSQQQQQQQQSIDSQSNSAYAMTDYQLEELVRRAIAAATRQNINRNVDQLYDREQARGINYNEHERNPAESYNPRRPYNDDLYQRFNAEEAIDRQEQRKLSYTRGFAPSEIVYTPTMRYNPYVLPGDEYQENIAVSGQSIAGSSEDNKAAWEAQQMSQGGQTTILEELREISREEEGEKNQQEDQENFRSTPDLMTTKRETDFETLLPPPINYRTHSRTSETQQVEQQQENTSKPLENNTQKDDQPSPPIAINPDLMEDMEIPPMEGSEVELQLSFQPFDNTTPSPTN